MKEQKIEDVFVATNVESHLADGEGEPGAELAQRLNDAVQERLLKVALGDPWLQTQEVEYERVFGQALRLSGVGRLKLGLKIGRCSSEPGPQLVHDLVLEHSTGPGVRGGLSGVPLAVVVVFELVEEKPHVAPPDLCHSLWHYFRTRCGEGAHVQKVTAVEAGGLGELDTEILGETETI
ncbi:hypothetical protein ATY41_06910 [Leifsonia xyli subsp. xyli]|uniref:Uncharacterized protein n=1 Tax=Leifsonia xyli subsp. xyli TaxID=59736 RepID=A0A1E2SMQ5_LEIXY|nr:hypothetical protein ATY41_06910 [Leifsonia xyli subsp. xyli]